MGKVPLVNSAAVLIPAGDIETVYIGILIANMILLNGFLNTVPSLT
ncbi:MAG: hypothetical protein ACJAYG_002492 [Oceanicoccus sp.]|jgi:hypothetical protein